MKDLFIKYSASVFIISLCCASEVTAQEDSFIYNNGSNREKLEVPSSPGSERAYRQPQEKVSDENQTQVDPKTPAETQAKEITPSIPKDETKTNPKEVQSPKTEAETSQKEEDTNSVLSFNFLHYLIQKYKFSDVIDH